MNSGLKHYFDEMTQRAEFIDQMLAGTVSLKYAYTGSSAQAHLRLARGAQYEQVTSHLDVELEAIRAIGATFYERIVDIGPGSGRHTRQLLHRLAGRGIGCHEYLGVDYSLALAQVNATEMTRVWGQLAIRRWSFLLQDLEDHPLALSRSGLPSLFCILGNTIGNIADPVNFIRNSYAPGTDQDRLIIGLTMPTPGAKVEDQLQPYRTSVFEEAVLAPFLACGIPRAAIRVRLATDNHAVVADVVFDRNVRLPAIEEAVTIPKGYVVKAFVSHRYNPPEAKRMIAETGLVLENEVTLRNGLVLCCRHAGAGGFVPAD